MKTTNRDGSPMGPEALLAAFTPRLDILAAYAEHVSDDPRASEEGATLAAAVLALRDDFGELYDATLVAVGRLEHGTPPALRKEMASIGVQVSAGVSEVKALLDDCGDVALQRLVQLAGLAGSFMVERAGPDAVTAARAERDARLAALAEAQPFTPEPGEPAADVAA